MTHVPGADQGIRKPKNRSWNDLKTYRPRMHLNWILSRRMGQFCRKTFDGVSAISFLHGFHLPSWGWLRALRSWKLCVAGKQGA